MRLKTTSERCPTHQESSKSEHYSANDSTETVAVRMHTVIPIYDWLVENGVKFPSEFAGEVSFLPDNPGEAWTRGASVPRASRAPLVPGALAQHTRPNTPCVTHFKKPKAQKTHIEPLRVSGAKDERRFLEEATRCAEGRGPLRRSPLRGAVPDFTIL